MTALVIDDDPIINETVSELMRTLGYDTASSQAPDEALRFIASERPDIILCDLSMPQMSGLEVFEKCRQVHPQAIFIVMTGYASIESAVNVMRMGACDYLQKPFSLEHLRLVVERAVGEKNLKQENRQLKVKLNSTKGQPALQVPQYHRQKPGHAKNL